MPTKNVKEAGSILAITKNGVGDFHAVAFSSGITLSSSLPEASEGVILGEYSELECPDDHLSSYSSSSNTEQWTSEIKIPQSIYQVSSKLSTAIENHLLQTLFQRNHPSTEMFIRTMPNHPSNGGFFRHQSLRVIDSAFGSQNAPVLKWTQWVSARAH